MKNHNLRGVGTVFRYTMQQHYKTRSVMVFLIILFALSLTVFPLLSRSSDTGKEVTETAITKLYIQNDLEFPINWEAIHNDSRYAKLDIALSTTVLNKDDLKELLNKEQTSAAAIVHTDASKGGFEITGYYGENGKITTEDMATLNRVLRDVLHEAILSSLNVSPEQEATVNSTAVSQVQLAEEFRSNKEIISTDTHMVVSMFYSYAIMLLSTLAMSYIFQLCIEEKTSKLVESLLVSVKPMALLVGKIAAVTCFLFIGLGLIGVGLFISYQIAKNINPDAAAASLAKVSGFFHVELGSVNLGIGNILLLLVSILIAYSISASFSGIVGSCCSKTEDLQHASVAVVLFLMIGYMTATMAPAFESDGTNAFLSIFPLTSMYVALPNYLCGKISAIVLIIGMAVQLLTAFFLARLAGSVYSMMLLYRGGFPKPKQLFRMLRENRASAKAAAGKEANHEA
ncbi:MAG: ABC transporter permease [Oscillospiraceae bacterium]|nr:ABC transporter permease [Oscillospiraceae bacterium]